jgi:hypothetical protein
MDDYPEDLMPPKDEIEDPIYEMDGPKEKKPKIRPISENLHRMLLGLCRDVEEGRIPSLRNNPLIVKTRKSKIADILPLARQWVKALEQERLQQNQGAIYWTKLLEAFPNFLEEDIPEEAEEWALRLRGWRA